jgi:uncharacterized protein (TIGR03643 family)
MDTKTLSPAHIDDIVQMALSDHVSFSDIKGEYGLGDNQVKALTRESLKPGSFRAWHKRVRAIGVRRAQHNGMP